MTTSLFEEPWWLDAVAPGTWQSITASDGGGACARLTLQLIRRGGLVIARNPPFTPIVGPAFHLTAKKHEGRMSQARSLVEGLIASLPPCHLTRLVFSPNFDDHLPFRWAGFQTGLACTYRLEDLTDVDRLWEELSESSRRAIRKAQKGLVVRDDHPLPTAIACIDKTFERQGLRVPFAKTTLKNVVEAAHSRSSATWMIAEDAEGRPHASAIIVYDHRCAYYLAGGADPSLRGSGAQSLLLWSAIVRASRLSNAFDFEGSSNASIERFFRGFAPRRVPLLTVVRRARIIRCLDSFGMLPAALKGL